MMPISHQIGGNRKRSKQSTKRESKIAVNGVFGFPQGDKWQSKTLFLIVFNPRSSVEITFSIAAAYPVCIHVCID